MELGTFVVVRTYSAGVHCGTLAAQDGKNVTLTDARRIWRWRGANTLHELALNGADKEWTRISEPVSALDLSEAIEVIACTSEARENLSASRWGK
ncbi:MAG: hypothetical protein RLZZ524_1317 [Pseudomonadota bacterium]|jgi:hypothetical protein